METILGWNLGVFCLSLYESSRISVFKFRLLVEQKKGNLRGLMIAVSWLKTNARLLTVLVRWNSIFIPAKLQQHNKNQFWGFDRAYKKAITCIFINSWRLQPILGKSEYRSVPPARSIPGISFSIQEVLWTKQRQARTCVGDAWHWIWNLDAEN